jgi:hypothetical protein
MKYATRKENATRIEGGEKTKGNKQCNTSCRIEAEEKKIATEIATDNSNNSIIKQGYNPTKVEEEEAEEICNTRKLCIEAKCPVEQNNPRVNESTCEKNNSGALT